MSKWNSLKEVSIDALEAAIAKAVTELIGEDYSCEIRSAAYADSAPSKFELILGPKVEMTEAAKGQDWFAT